MHSIALTLTSSPIPCLSFPVLPSPFPPTCPPPQSLNNLGVLYTSQGRAQEALQLLQAALVAKPDYAGVCAGGGGAAGAGVCVCVCARSGAQGAT